MAEKIGLTVVEVTPIVFREIILPGVMEKVVTPVGLLK
jgi:hypothetical protein